MIVDDASLIDEAEIIQGALRFGCQRLILLGNRALKPDIFGLVDASRSGIAGSNLGYTPWTTLFERVINVYQEYSHPYLKSMNEFAEPKKAPSTKNTKAK